MRRHSITPQAKAIAKLDRALSILVRSDPIFSDNGACITCGAKDTLFDCGHFRRRECMSTRYDYRNLGLQCRKCNHFESGRPYEFSLWIDKKWGRGTAKQLARKSAMLKQWEIPPLEQLAHAASKLGFNAYKQLYDSFHEENRT